MFKNKRLAYLEQKERCDGGFHEWEVTFGSVSRQHAMSINCKHCHEPAKPSQYDRQFVDTKMGVKR